MSLTEKIQHERDVIQHLEKVVKDAREERWDANFRRRHDARRPGESEEHWHERRKRNRVRFENKDDAVDHIVKKIHAHEKMRDDLIERRFDYRETRREERDKYKKGSVAIVTFDGKACVEDLAYWLDLIRGKGKWSGVLVSGYRTPAYSIQLCMNMCGAPYCPGRCAGASTNHAKTTYPGPAGDVTDYFRCEDALIDVGSGYFNDLPLDLVHMSRSGH